MQELPGQDGGLYGWVAVFTAWTVTLIWAVFVKGLGIMLPSLQEQFETTTALTGWVIAAICTTTGAGGNDGEIKFYVALICHDYVYFFLNTNDCGTRNLRQQPATD